MTTRRGFLLVPVLGLLPGRSGSGLTLPPSQRTTRILFGGDVMLSRYVAAASRSKGDPAWPLRGVGKLFSEADIAFVNLESPFSDRGRRVERGMVFKAEPEMIDALCEAGIDIVSTANNHARDCGSYGVTFTLEWLRKNGIAAVGTGGTAEIAHQGVVLERNGIRFGFLAYTFDQSNGNYTDLDDRIAMLDAKQMARDAADLLRRADVAIVSMHAGWEYWKRPNSWQTGFARAAIDAGATVVVGHHPHVRQPVEKHKDGVIFYSLGNLVFDQVEREANRGLVADVRFIGKKLASFDTIPVDIAQGAARPLELRSGTERR